jgi:RNA polymerase sigma-70 factor (ECF subfamily)
MTDEPDRDEFAAEDFRYYLMVLTRAKLGWAPKANLECSDVVQVTLLEAVRKRDQFRGRSRAEMAGWLRQMLAFNLADAIRDRGRAKRDPSRVRSLQEELDRSSARLGAMLAADQSTPSRAAGRHEDAVRLAGALEGLPDDQRQAVILRHCEGCSIDEISRRMDRSQAAVAGLIKRGLRGLRVLLEERG